MVNTVYIKYVICEHYFIEYKEIPKVNTFTFHEGVRHKRVESRLIIYYYHTDTGGDKNPTHYKLLRPLQDNRTENNSNKIANSPLSATCPCGLGNGRPTLLL